MHQIPLQLPAHAQNYFLGHALMLTGHSSDNTAVINFQTNLFSLSLLPTSLLSPSLSTFHTFPSLHSPLLTLPIPLSLPSTQPLPNPFLKLPCNLHILLQKVSRTFLPLPDHFAALLVPRSRERKQPFFHSQI
ncbi:unnamed protein product [Closterium sp. NIES-53]